MKRFVEIGVEGIEQRRFGAFDGGLQSSELRLPVGQRARDASLEMLALLSDEWCEIHN